MEVRRAEFDDVKGLNELISSTGGASIFKATFGAYNLSSMIENAVASLLTTNKKVDVDGNDQVEILSFLSLNDGIALVSENEAFSKTVAALSHYVPATANNTSFINFWIVDEMARNHEQAAFEMVKKAFSICSHTDFLAWLCPKNFAPSDFINRTFSQLKFDMSDGWAHDSIKFLDGYKVFILHRSSYLPKLNVREARIEDNDDLIPILRNSNPDVLLGQEAFFLAELIQSQDNANSFYVGLKKNQIAGMLATNLDVNVQLILKLFDIGGFPDLIIKKEERQLPPPLLISIVGDLRLVDTDAVQDIVKGLNCLFINAETMKLVYSGDGGGTAEETKQGGTDDAGNPVQASSENSALLQFIEAYRADQINGAVLPPAIVLFGYPRNESEAYDRLKDMVYHFDYLIEIQNSAEDAEEDDEDDFLQHHLDAVEVLREQYFNGLETRSGVHHIPQHHASHYHGHHHDANHPPLEKIPGQHRAHWRKVSVHVNSTADEDYNKSEAQHHLSVELHRIMDNRMMKIETQRQKDREEPPKANAFAISVFAMQEDYHSRGQDLVKIAFEEHPGQDYCLFMAPNNNPPPPDLVRFMTFVNTRPGISFDQSLYISHRSCFLVDEYLQVRRLTPTFVPVFEEFVATLPSQQQKALLDGAASCLTHHDVDLRDNPAEVCFSVCIGNTIVGAVLLSRKIASNEDCNWFRANYHLDELVNLDRHRARNQAVITQWLVDPVYSPYTRRIVQEIMRVCFKTLLYFQSDRIVAPPKEILEEFVLLKPRRRMQAFGTQQVEYLERPSGGLGSDCPLLCITKHFLTRPKITVAKRVVVVGGSSHSFAMLDTLLTVPYLNFPNVFYVVDRPPDPLSLTLRHGPGSNDEEAKYDDDYSGCFSLVDEHFPREPELFALGLGHKIHLVVGHLTDIDREHKAIVVSGEQVLEYDLLILSTSTRDGSYRSIPALKNMHPARCADIGIFCLGNPGADIQALRYIRHRYNNRNNDVVVSGSGLAVFSAAAKLMQLGVSANRITVVVREGEGNVEGLTDRNLLEPMIKAVLSVGVKICWGFTIGEVHFSHSGFLSGVELQRTAGMHEEDISHIDAQLLQLSAHGEDENGGVNHVGVEEELTNPSAGILVSCLALLCCSNQVCERDMFNAIVDCGLVFDGGLVVDHNFRTVDPAIYAASDFTRFSRVYREAIPHARYNPCEVGAYVALKILEQHLDPTTKPVVYATRSAANSSLVAPHVSTLPPSTKRPPIPNFQLPRSWSCELPGGMCYFCSQLPVMALEAMSYITNGQIVNESFSFTPSRNRICILKTSLLGIVQGFTYLGEDRIETRNVGTLPGIHESYLNSAIHAHGRGFVSDWIDYFRQEWASALFQDKFSTLVQSLRRAVSNDKGMLMLLSRVFERAENCQDESEVSEMRRELLGAHGELVPEGTILAVEADTLEFIKENKAVLPRYYIPSK